MPNKKSLRKTENNNLGKHARKIKTDGQLTAEEAEYAWHLFKAKLLALAGSSLQLSQRTIEFYRDKLEKLK